MGVLFLEKSAFALGLNEPVSDWWCRESFAMCVLRIVSPSCSFRDRPELEMLPVVDICEKGDARFGKSRRPASQFSVTVEVSNAEWDELPSQFDDACEFLQNYWEELRSLLDLVADGKGCLDFPCWSRLSEGVLMQSDVLPANLISLAGRLGLEIELSCYQKSFFDEVDEPDKNFD
ncbi:hypothetical protein [Roseibacillus ishigakijimensis]|uniref:DUF4279 domain-containing protein n=1 Tax=Roseibacillus ishigakijimensis TaxID=454146 RepID=A0A934RQS4_9BACT|nr:hypothetical protein [Roseibacillus ishigakijimensis]